MIDSIRCTVNPEKFDRYYFPVNVKQVEDLLGKTLTQLEIMNLRNEKATKDVFRQLIWAWFDAAQENSMTSYQGCIAPVFSFSKNGEVLTDGPQTNRWHPICPNGCDDNASCSECPPAETADTTAIYDVYPDGKQFATVDDAKPGDEVAKESK